MDPLTLLVIWLIKSAIVGATATGVVASAIYIARLTLPVVVNWFSQNRRLSTGESQLLAVTLDQGLKEGKHVVVQGIFDRRANKLVEGRTIKTSQMDESLARRHRGKEMVIYESYEY